MKRTGWSLVVLSFLLVPVGGEAQAAPAPLGTPAPVGSVERLAWMAGCWVLSTGSRTVEEVWLMPAGGTMVGLARTVGASGTSFEHLVLDGRAAGTVVYRATPEGAAPTDFTATQVTDSMAVFENPLHDYPQRIIYSRRGAESLNARIEGPDEGGRVVGSDFRYRRSACPGGDPGAS